MSLLENTLLSLKQMNWHSWILLGEWCYTFWGLLNVSYRLNGGNTTVSLCNFFPGCYQVFLPYCWVVYSCPASWITSWLSLHLSHCVLNLMSTIGGFLICTLDIKKPLTKNNWSRMQMYWQLGVYVLVLDYFRHPLHSSSHHQNFIPSLLPDFGG